MSRRTCAESETSAPMWIASPPAARTRVTVCSPEATFQSLATIFAPSLANNRAAARPCPPPAPVMIATLSFSRIFASPPMLSINALYPISEIFRQQFHLAALCVARAAVPIFKTELPKESNRTGGGQRRGQRKLRQRELCCGSHMIGLLKCPATALQRSRRPQARRHEVHDRGHGKPGAGWSAGGGFAPPRGRPFLHQAARRLRRRRD